MQHLAPYKRFTYFSGRMLLKKNLKKKTKSSFSFETKN